MTFPAPDADREAMQVGMLDTPDGASLAGESGGGHEQTGSSTAAVIQAGDPFPGNPQGGHPV